MIKHEILIENDQNCSADGEKHNNELNKSGRRWLFFGRNQSIEQNKSCSEHIAPYNSLSDTYHSSNDDLVNTENSENSSNHRFGCFGNMFRFIKRKLFKNSSKKAKRTKLNNDSVSEESKNIPKIRPSPKLHISPNIAHIHRVLRQERTSTVIINREPTTFPEIPNPKINEPQPETKTLEQFVQPNQNNTNQIRKRKRKPKKRANNKLNENGEKPPMEVILHPELKKYWVKRYSLFSKYREGIRMDAESWYSVTPERISRDIAERCRSDVIIDGFCGAGGNTIQFAFTCERVIAIDIDEEKIKMAKHNAEIYEVADRIEFIVGDFFKVVPSLRADVIFLSPPWGGPQYTKMEEFPLSGILEPYGGKMLFDVARQVTSDIAYYLPRNINRIEVAQLQEGYVKISKHFLDTKFVAITAYFGELVEDYDD